MSDTPEGLTRSGDDGVSAVKWQPLSPRQRRVAGVLIEKAKTVPDTYPMTINGLISGCNQKSNRDPHMELTEEDLEQVLEELRGMGAVVEVQGSGRVPKFKHNLYEWFGVDKVEMAVLAELLLRGPQTLGELRTRASRMEPIPDLGALQNLLRLLQSKNLVLELTPPGRGQIVTHNIYKDRELPELKARYAGYRGSGPDADEDSPAVGSSPPTRSHSPPSTGVTLDMFAELRVEVAELRAEVARLRTELQKVLQ